MANKIIFFGTSEFAVPVLEALNTANYPITLVVTTPGDSPIKNAVERLDLEIIQPASLKDPVFVQVLSSKLQVTSVGLVASYGKIIPAEIIALFPLGILNIHPSLLPHYR